MMEFRLAEKEDLPQLKAVYGAIIKHMDRNGVRIWDDIYPCSFFAEDIAQKRLYILLEQGEIAAAFALCASNPGAESVKWENRHGKALYLDRLGVNTGHMRKGTGALALQKAAALAGAQGAEYLRLFVVDSNLPAISLYEKNGFRRAEGCYDEVIDEGLVLREFGYEIKIPL